MISFCNKQTGDFPLEKFIFIVTMIQNVTTSGLFIRSRAHRRKRAKY